MANKRAMKRRQRQAKLVLIRRHNYAPKEFFRADAETAESHNIQVGTWMWGAITGYYEPEWDEKLPSDILGDLRLIERTDWDAEFRKDHAEWEAAQAERRYRAEAERATSPA